MFFRCFFRIRYPRKATTGAPTNNANTRKAGLPLNALNGLRAIGWLIQSTIVQELPWPSRTSNAATAPRVSAPLRAKAIESHKVVIGSMLVIASLGMVSALFPGQEMKVAHVLHRLTVSFRALNSYAIMTTVSTGI